MTISISGFRYQRRFLFGVYLALNVAFALSACTQKPAEPSLFQQLPSSKTNIHFINKISDQERPGILDYLYYYNGGGVATGDINNDGLPDIFFTANHKGGNKLYLNKGNYQFEDITAKAGIDSTADWSTGVTMADVNNDGYLDIYVCAVAGKLNLKGHNLLYINNHNGTFTESSAKYGLDFSGYSTQAVFFDYDHDGKLDCFLLNQSNHSVGTYGDTSLRQKDHPQAGSRLYHQVNGKFVDVTVGSGIYHSALGYGLGVAVGDINNDGWEDIYVGNDFHENDYYYINNHNGTFTESGAKYFNHYSRFSMGNDLADFNNDGQLDIVTADMLPAEESILKTYGGDESYDLYKYKIVAGGFQYQYSRNCLQKNLGNGEAFSEVGLMDGIAATDWSWSSLFADFDNDGIKDLFIANGIKRRASDMDYVSFISNSFVQKTINYTNSLDSALLEKMPTGEAQSFIFKGTSSEKFIDKSAAWGMAPAGLANGAAYVDLNNDGQLDLVVNNVNREATIYKNTRSDAGYLTLKFNGKQDNKFGIGVKAYVYCGKQMQYQQLMLTRGFESAVEPKLHFGLNTQKKVDSILVVWPNQTWQVLKNVKTGQLLTIDQANAAGRFDQERFFPSPKPIFTDVSKSINLNWKHHEDDFVDFNQQPLIPHMISAMGPKMAVADVNHDGLDDFYICGARNQAGALFIQTGNGSFQLSTQTAFKADSVFEDVDAVFLDANHDGQPDLYVVSGGNEAVNGSVQLADRLYINDGKGNFSKSTGLPSILVNKSAVTVADVNHDGHPDIFVAGAPDAMRYGSIPESYLLMNDGKGNYKKAAIPDELKYAGMIHSAVFGDLDNDGWPDLVVAGEWMPVKVYMNQHGKLVEKHQADRENLSGWWQNVSLADVDGDGKLDILAGNYGLNSKLTPTFADPVKLFLSDIDKNGTVDPILTHSKDGKDYTFLGKGDIEKQVPVLKKKYLFYHEFAGKTVQEIFGDALGDSKPWMATSFSSGIFYNEGNGNFKFSAFPSSAQVAPIFAMALFNTNQNKSVLAGGNFSGVLPYEGRYDADFGDVLTVGKNRALKSISPVSAGFVLRGQVRDIKALKTAHGVVYAVAFNNDKIQFFKPNN